MSNERKDRQLGMPYGTARNKLIKQLLFELVVETNKNICFRCNLEISDINNFSVEHKLPFLDSGFALELFFDKENIAYSHLDCNSKNRRSYIGESDYPGIQIYAAPYSKFKYRAVLDKKILGYGNDPKILFETYIKNSRVV